MCAHQLGYTVHVHCAVPENIHTPPQERLEFPGGEVGGTVRPKNLKNVSLKLSWNFKGGGPEGVRQNPLGWGGMGYFLELHIVFIVEVC